MREVTCPESGLVNSPAHWLNRVDVHCVPYTPLQLFLFAGGCLLWVVAYGIIIRNAKKLGVMEMAAVAGCSNFAWEGLWSFAFRTDMGLFLVYTYRAWFFLDLYIFWKLLDAGRVQMLNPALLRHFKAYCLFVTASFGVLYFFFTRNGYDTPVGANSAYIAQLFISFLCLELLLRTSDLRGFSFHVGWLRTFGTGANTVFMFLHYPENRFVQAMGTLSFGLDLAYLVLLVKKKKKRSAAPPLAETLA